MRHYFFAPAKLYRKGAARGYPPSRIGDTVFAGTRINVSLVYGFDILVSTARGWLLSVRFPHEESVPRFRAVFKAWQSVSRVGAVGWNCLIETRKRVLEGSLFEEDKTRNGIHSRGGASKIEPGRDVKKKRGRLEAGRQYVGARENFAARVSQASLAVVTKFSASPASAVAAVAMSVDVRSVQVAGGVVIQQSTGGGAACQEEQSESGEIVPCAGGRWPARMASTVAVAALDDVENDKVAKAEKTIEKL